jgi:hypothetical protein
VSGAPGFNRFFTYEPPEGYDRRWMRDLVDRVSEAFLRVVTTTEAAPFVLLLSPAGKVFRVTVSDAGVLAATEVPQGDASQ